MRWILGFTALALALAGCAGTNESTGDRSTTGADCPDATSDDTTMTGGDGASNSASGGDSTSAGTAGQIGNATDTTTGSGGMDDTNATDDCPSDANVVGAGDHTAGGT